MPGNRLEQLAQNGARSLDVAVPEWRCAKCGKKLDDSVSRVVAGVFYGTLEEAFDVSLEVARSLKSEVRRCATCGKKVKPSHVDYHMQHSSEQKDLVIRWCIGHGLLGRMKSELLWWAPDSDEYTAAAELSSEQLVRFQRDALLRAAEGSAELSGYEAASIDIEAAYEHLAGDAELIGFVPGLLDVGKSGLAGAILDAHIEAHPDDPDGHFWLGETVIRVVASGIWPTEKLEEADTSISKALELRPDYEEAEIASCTIARLRGDDDLARSRFEGLLTKYPNSALAHYNLGLMKLEGDAEVALEHFRDGAEQAPDDPDYPVGVARALVKLDRLAEARDAVAWAKRLAPEHPLPAELEDIETPPVAD